MMTPGEYALFLRESAARCRPALETIVREVAMSSAEYARHLIGHLQPTWEPLAFSTRLQKRRLGYRPPDYEPLLRGGQMRDSIEGVSEGLTGIVGSPSKILLYQEAGTAKIPPRPVTSLAVHEFAIPALQVECEALVIELLTPGIE